VCSGTSRRSLVAVVRPWSSTLSVLVKLIVPFEIDLPIIPFVGRVHSEGRRVIDLQSMVVSSLVEIGGRLGQAGVKRRGNGTRVTVAR
jgi:hypothetical protein